MQATMANLRRLARRHGATVDESGIEYGTIYVDAPDGKLWACDQIHMLAVHWQTDSAGRACPVEWKRDAIEDVYERIADGLDDCCEENCEVCENLQKMR